MCVEKANVCGGRAGVPPVTAEGTTEIKKYGKMAKGPKGLLPRRDLRRKNIRRMVSGPSLLE